ncbi:MAG: patatin-like phospholipase family protein [Candidatus Cloacimonetes bacterium]|nr:patatin-like phospholipase family protein [Candidatus Cloacimonadota bacterium]
MKSVGIALGGGGARGLCHIQFLKTLDEMNIKPTIISGTSIGAIIGAFYAAGLSGLKIEEILNNLNLLDYGKFFDFTLFSNTGIIKGNAFENFIAKHLPVDKFEDLAIPLKIVATNFWKREQVVFDSGYIIPAIRASISVPGIFDPVKINDVVLTDGGATNPVPFDIIADKCDINIAIDVSGKANPKSKSKIPSISECVLTSFHIMEKAVVENKMKLVKPDIFIKPNLYDIQLMEFHKSKEILKSVEPNLNLFKDLLNEKIYPKKKYFNFMHKK